MKKMKLMIGLALCSTAFASQIQANEPWEWSNGDFDCSYEYDDGCCEGKILWLSEFLWWTPGNTAPFANNDFVNDGLAITSTTAPFASEVDTVNEPYARISEKWSMGNRIGLGWESGEERWQIWGLWTGYSNYARRVLNATPPPPVAPPVFGAGLNEGFIDFPVVGDVFPGNVAPAGLSATATYKLNFNVADLVFGKPLCLCDSLELMPFAGVRAAFIHQRDALKLQGLADATAIPGIFAFEGTNNRAYQNLWAVGPRLGLAATLGDWCGFNLLGTISGGILYGRMEQGYSVSSYDPRTTIDSKDSILQDPTVIISTYTTTKDRYNLIVPNLQVQLGFGYEMEICLFQRLFNINCFAMWEGNTYWGASNRLLFERQLSLTGLTTGCAVSF